MNDADVRICLIWAMAENRVIGRDNGLPWRLPGEMQYFRSATLGKPVVMGRRTFESLPKPLPGRTNIVVSRTLEVDHPRVRLARTLDEGLVMAREQAVTDGVDEVMVMGGAEIYAATLPMADRLYLTLVHARPEGDVLFPEFAADDWIERRRLTVPADADNVHAFSLIVLERP